MESKESYNIKPKKLPPTTHTELQKCIEPKPTGGGAIFVIYETPDFHRLLNVARGLSLDFFPIIFSSPYFFPETAQFALECEKEGFKYVHWTNEFGGQNCNLESLRRELGTAAAWRRSPYSWGDLSFRWQVTMLLGLALPKKSLLRQSLREFMFAALQILDFLSLVNASLVVLPEDNTERDSHLWLSMCSLYDVKTVVYAKGWVLSDRIAEVYAEDTRLWVNDRSRRFLAKLFPKWVHTWKHRSFFRLPCEKWIAMELLGTAPAKPWALNTGPSDIVAVDCNLTLDQYAEFRVPRDKMHVVGSIDFDKLIDFDKEREQKTQHWSEKLGIDWHKPILVVSPPKDYFWKHLVPGIPTYRALLEKLFVSLGAWRGQVIIAPHPSISEKDLTGCQYPVIRHQIAELVQLCDLYLTFPSSTLKLAASLNIPTTVFEPYGTNSFNESLLKNSVLISTFEHLESHLRAGQEKRIQTQSQSGSAPNSATRFRNLVLSVLADSRK